MALKTTSDLLNHFAHALGSLEDADYMSRTGKAQAILPAITDNDPTTKVALYTADVPCTLVSVTIVPTTAYTANANLNSIEIKNNGVAVNAARRIQRERFCSAP